MAPTAPDLERMQVERADRVRARLLDTGVAAAVLLHGPNVTYTTGAPTSGSDASHAVHQRPIAIVTADEPPHLIGSLDPELDEDMPALARALNDRCGAIAGRPVAVDELSGAMLRADVLAGAELVDAARILGPARITKTPDELACIDAAQRATTTAMASARTALRPGARRSSVAGAFLARLRELGAGPNLIDPIFEVMPRRRADGSRTNTGDVAFPTGCGDPVFGADDLVWVDAGVDHHGYASDFGTTWIVGRDPDAGERALEERWRVVVAACHEAIEPGASLGDIGRAAIAANDGVRPWLPHFYLAHGLGVESAEMPMIGTDLGQDFDDGFLLAPGMVLVFEPVVWADGVGGYRAEEIVVVTEDGWEQLGT